MRLQRVVDLSRAIGPETQPYPGDPVPHISTATTIADSGVNSVRVQLGSHSGTHADAPFHFFDDGARLDELPLELFAGPAVVVNVTGRDARAPIARGDLEPWGEQFGPGVVVLLRTGWSAHYGTARYLDHPYLTQDAAGFLVERGVRTVGVDCPSPDETPHGDHQGGGWAAHRVILGVGGTIIENLCHLDRIDFAMPWFCAFPIRLASDDGAPVRAVVMSWAD